MSASDRHGDEDRDPREAFLDGDSRKALDEHWPWPHRNSPEPIAAIILDDGENRFFQTEGYARDELGRDSIDLNPGSGPDCILIPCPAAHTEGLLVASPALRVQPL